jgi:Zn-dependent peptidase ImmA (M78 family)
VVVHEHELPAGYLGMTDHARKVIWLDSRLTDAEKRSTLAHELGHLTLDTYVYGALVTALEPVVDAWAARKLISISGLLSAMNWSEQLCEVAEELFVSEHMVRTRLRTLTDEEKILVMRSVRRIA